MSPFGSFVGSPCLTLMSSVIFAVFFNDSRYHWKESSKLNMVLLKPTVPRIAPIVCYQIAPTTQPPYRPESNSDVESRAITVMARSPFIVPIVDSRKFSSSLPASFKFFMQCSIRISNQSGLDQHATNN